MVSFVSYCLKLYSHLSTGSALLTNKQENIHCSSPGSLSLRELSSQWIKYSNTIKIYYHSVNGIASSTVKREHGWVVVETNIPDFVSTWLSWADYWLSPGTLNLSWKIIVGVRHCRTRHSYERCSDVLQVRCLWSQNIVSANIFMVTVKPMSSHPDHLVSRCLVTMTILMPVASSCDLWPLLRLLWMRIIMTGPRCSQADPYLDHNWRKWGCPGQDDNIISRTEILNYSSGERMLPAAKIIWKINLSKEDRIYRILYPPSKGSKSGFRATELRR